MKLVMARHQTRARVSKAEHNKSEAKQTQRGTFIPERFSWISWQGSDATLELVLRFGNRNWGCMTGLSKPLRAAHSLKPPALPGDIYCHF
jgi:hypothetical protein